MEKLKEYTIGGKFRVIENLWKKFIAAYGVGWIKKYGEVTQKNERTGNKELTQIGSTWILRLGRFTEDTIGKAIESCEDVHPDRPPNLFQFAKLCKQNSPKEKNPYQNPHLCEHTDERGFRCGNSGTMSSNIHEGGPWLCAAHHFNDSRIQKRRGKRERLAEQYHDEFKQKHPEPWSQPDDKPGDVGRRNLKFVKDFLKGGTIGQELPYDKNVRYAGEDEQVTREESITRAEKEANNRI